MNPIPPISPEERAFLNVLQLSESNYSDRDPYAVLYGGDVFTDFGKDFSWHPGISRPIGSGPNEGSTTTAAGRYQFLEGTWNEIARRYGLKDFSPQSQDLGAVLLARERYGSDPLALTRALQSGDPSIISGVGRRLAPTWTSLPGGIEENSAGSPFYNNYIQALNQPTTPAQRAGASMAGAVAPTQRAAPAAPIQWNSVTKELYPDPRLSNATSQAVYAVLGPGWSIDVNNAYRPGDPRFHGKRLAWDFGIVNNETGERLRWDDPRTKAVAMESAARGVAGFGAGPDYMGGATFHFDYRPGGIGVWSDDDGKVSTGGPGAAMWLQDLRQAREQGSTRGMFAQGSQQNGAISAAMLGGAAAPAAPPVGASPPGGAPAGGPIDPSYNPTNPIEEATKQNPSANLGAPRQAVRPTYTSLSATQSITPSATQEGGLRPTRRMGRA